MVFEKIQRVPPPPIWGRIEVGEASDDCLAPKRGFPLPTLPHVRGGESQCTVFICDCPAPQGGKRLELGLAIHNCGRTVFRAMDPGGTRGCSQTDGWQDQALPWEEGHTHGTGG